MHLRSLLLDFFLPRPVSVYCGVELNRCQTDGQIVTRSMGLENHAGHYVKSPVVLTLREKVLIWMGVIR